MATKFPCKFCNKTVAKNHHAVECGKKQKTKLNDPFLWMGFNCLKEAELSLKLQKNPISSIQLPGYDIEYTPTECSNGVALLYIKK